MATIPVERIKDLIKETPNDMELGKKIRSFISKIQIENKKENIKK